jgi:hypothetical protein
MLRAAFALIGLFFLAGLDSPLARARSSLNRCLGSDGVSVYTDRACAELQAIERPAQTKPQDGAKVYVQSCARTPEDLLLGVRSALEAQDVNRLAGFYHWAGIDSAQANRLMDLLSDVSARPLVDVRLISRSTNGDRDANSTMIDASTDEPDSESESNLDATVPRPTPDFLRVDQMLNEQNAASQITFFRLQENVDCWWIRF